MEKIEKLVLDTDTILYSFGLPRLREGALIDQWITTTLGELSIDELNRLKKLHKKTLRSGDGWNEEELKTKSVKSQFEWLMGFEPKMSRKCSRISNLEFAKANLCAG